MHHFFPTPLIDSPENLMSQLGYRYHCTEAGKMCYHRELGNGKFPRFHAFLEKHNNGVIISLHFDAEDKLHHQSNRNEAWAHKGGRVDEEMRRITDVMSGRIKPKKEVYHAITTDDQMLPKKKEKKKKSLFEILFKDM